MVIRRTSARRPRGALIIELVVAMAIFLMAFVPLGVLATREHRLARALYFRAVAGEILDGELEVLLAGGWRTLTAGTNVLTVQAEATNSLPPGRFEAVLEAPLLTVRWHADLAHSGGDTERRGRVVP